MKNFSEMTKTELSKIHDSLLEIKEATPSLRFSVCYEGSYIMVNGKFFFDEQSLDDYLILTYS